MHRGYFPVWRKFFEEHPFWKEKRKFSKAEAWIDILVNSNHKDKPIQRIVNGRMVTIEHGECVMTTRYCGRRWGWHNSSVHDFLGLLKKMGQIQTLVEHRMTKITILNYSQYNTCPNTNPNTEVNTGRTMGEHWANELNNLRIKEEEVTIVTSCPEVPPAPSEPTPAPLAVIEVPLVAKYGSFGITQPMIDDWQTDYPGVDVVIELRKLRQWNISNPKQRKTKSGILKHITSWLGRAQDNCAQARLPPNRPDQPMSYGEKNRNERAEQLRFLRRLKERENGNDEKSENPCRSGEDQHPCPGERNEAIPCGSGRGVRRGVNWF